MRLSSLVKLGLLVPVVTFVAGLGALAVGCGSSYGNDGGYTNGPPIQEQPSPEPRQVAIDTGATIKASPGGGVGVFVEYTAGGHWQIVTQCDTNTSGLPCGFDVFVRTATVATASSTTTQTTPLSNPQGLDLAGQDTVAMDSDGSLHLSTNTAANNGGMTFDSTAGATVELEMYLDDNLQPDFVYWVGDAVLHTGAPTDPILFAPSAP
jgi:hypothetical protein